jgi:hypothetical protein
MVSVKIQNSGHIKKLFKAYETSIEADTGEALKQLASNIATRLAGLTPPNGTNNKAKAQGEKSLVTDIHKVYANVYHVASKLKKYNVQSAAAFVKACNDGDYQSAQRIVSKYMTISIVNSVDGRAHDQSKSNGVVADNTKTKEAFTDLNSAQAYKDQEKANVGFAKAGWIKSAESIRTKKRKAPVWLRNKGLGGSIISKKSIIIYNNANYISNILSTSAISKSIEISVKATMRQFQYALDKSSNKFNAS